MSESQCLKKIISRTLQHSLLHIIYCKINMKGKIDFSVLFQCSCSCRCHLPAVAYSLDRDEQSVLFSICCNPPSPGHVPYTLIYFKCFHHHGSCTHVCVNTLLEKTNLNVTPTVMKPHRRGQLYLIVSCCSAPGYSTQTQLLHGCSGFKSLSTLMVL